MDKGTTKPGFVSKNQLRVIGQTVQRSDTHPNGGLFYALECLQCGALIKSNGCDIYDRTCLACEDA